MLTKKLFCYINFFCLFGWNVLAEENPVQITEQSQTTQVGMDIAEKNNVEGEINTAINEALRNVEDIAKISAINNASDRHRKNYTGPKCEGNDNCESICRDLYIRSVRNECLALSIEQVEILKKIDKIFENPNEINLVDIHAYDFETYLYIDQAPFRRRVQRFNLIQSKMVLSWLVNDSSIVDVFRNLAEYESEGYNLFGTLLRGMNADVKQALKMNILSSGRGSFMEVIVQKYKYNVEISYWINEFFYKECGFSDASKPLELCVFQEWYCQGGFNKPILGGDIEEENVEEYRGNLKDYWEDLFVNDYFRNVAAAILSDYTTSDFVNGNPDDESTRKEKVHWWTDEVEEVNKLNESVDLKDLCDMPLVERI